MSDKVTDIEFDASAVDPAAPMEIIPAGWYMAEIEEAELVETSKGDGTMVKVVFAVAQGDFLGRKVFANINFSNPNPTAERIGQQELSGICHAVNEINLQSLTQFNGKQLFINVGVQKARTDETTGKSYEESNRYRGCRSLDDPPKGFSTTTSAAPPTKPASGRPGPAKAATSAKPAATKPGPAKPAAPKPGPKAPPAKPKEDRLFWAYIGEESVEMKESEIAAKLAAGELDADTQITLQDVEEWKTIADFGIEPGEAAAPKPKAPPWAKQIRK